MGAAKNARKARRKARRCEDRKLSFDMESTSSFSLADAIDASRHKLLEFPAYGDAFADLFYGNYSGHGRGSSGKLSAQVADALSRRKAIGFDLPGYFNDSYINKLLGDNTPRTRGITGKTASRTLKDDVDFSSVEMRVIASYLDAKKHDLRIWDTLDKKRTYELMYLGSPPMHMKYEDLYMQKPVFDPVHRPQSPTGRMALHQSLPYYSINRHGKVHSS